MMRMHNQLILSSRSSYTGRPINHSFAAPESWRINPIPSLEVHDYLSDARLAEQEVLAALLMRRPRLSDDIVL